jgi:protein-disulfide isomerase
MIKSKKQSMLLLIALVAIAAFFAYSSMMKKPGDEPQHEAAALENQTTDAQPDVVSDTASPEAATTAAPAADAAPAATVAEAAAEATPAADAAAETTPAETPKSDIPLSALHSIMEEDVVEGKADAPVTIIEYSSLSCPHCAAFYKSTLPELKKKYVETGKVKFTNRQFPLNEPALKAAMLVDCVGKDRALQFTKVLFEMQDKWAFSTDFKTELKKIAAVGGFSDQEFEACMANKAIEEKMVMSRQTAVDKLNINSTPTFFVNGTELKGQLSLQVFDNAINAALPAAK